MFAVPDVKELWETLAVVMFGVARCAWTTQFLTKDSVETTKAREALIKFVPRVTRTTPAALEELFVQAHMLCRCTIDGNAVLFIDPAIFVDATRRYLDPGLVLADGHCATLPSRPRPRVRDQSSGMLRCLRCNEAVKMDDGVCGTGLVEGLRCASCSSRRLVPDDRVPIKGSDKFLELLSTMDLPAKLSAAATQTRFYINDKDKIVAAWSRESLKVHVDMSQMSVWRG